MEHLQVHVSPEKAGGMCSACGFYGQVHLMYFRDSQRTFLRCPDHLIVPPAAGWQTLVMQDA